MFAMWKPVARSGEYLSIRYWPLVRQLQVIHHAGVAGLNSLLTVGEPHVSWKMVCSLRSMREKVVPRLQGDR